MFEEERKKLKALRTVAYAHNDPEMTRDLLLRCDSMEERMNTIEKELEGVDDLPEPEEMNDI